MTKTLPWPTRVILNMLKTGPMSSLTMHKELYPASSNWREFRERIQKLIDKGLIEESEGKLKLKV